MAQRYYTTAHISDNQKETPEGFLLCLNVPIARTGALVYAANETPIETPTDRAIVTRTPAVLFDASTIASFEGKPVTLTHPDEMISPNNWKKFACGITQNVRAGVGNDADKLVADLLITDREAIYAVKNGLREVSCGYDAEYVQDGPGQGHQEDIIGNHVALVPSGRCGQECAIQDTEPETLIKESSRMDKIKALKEKFKGLFSAFDAALDELPVDEKKEEEKPPAKTADAECEKKEEEAPAFDAAVALDAFSKRLSKIEDSFAEFMKAKKEEKNEEKTKDEAPPTIDAETIARAEILAPGIAAGADIMPAALKAAYATTDGKAIIDTLSGGKAPAFDSVELFTAAAELLKEKRTTAFAGTKTAPAADAKTVDAYATFQQKAAEMFPIPKFN